MSQLAQALQKMGDEFRRNRRLQWGLMVIAIVLFADLGARWKDRIDANQKKLAQTQIDLATLKRQAKNEEAMAKALNDARRAAELADARLWVVTSEAVGQAKVKDWLADLLRQAGVGNASINVAAARAVVGQQDESSGAGASKPGVGVGLYEFSATSAFAFTPDSLEKLLAAVESGEPLARIESLSVRRNERRVELGVRVLIRLKGDSS
ncbi:MAG: hypothetical protein KIS62_09275 [Ramlibacter sp.]|nr:hypothetical protein [Ramlibacter sp.]